MQMIAVLCLMSLIAFLNGCQSLPGELITKQKFIFMKVVEVDGKKFVNLDDSFCAEREYKYSKQFIGPITKYQKVSFDQCNKLTGETPVQYTAKANWFEDVRKEIEKYD